jgi:Spy/CpxP family protein refolding chaperone
VVFQTLIRRRPYLLTLVAIILSIIYSFPVFANSRLLLPKQLHDSITQTIVANNSTATNSSQQSIGLFQRLNLNQEQQQQIRRIHQQYKRQIRKKRHSIDKLQQQLSNMMVGTEPVELLRAKNERLSVLRQEIGALRFESMLAIRNILTPQQRQKYKELVNSQLSE